MKPTIHILNASEKLTQLQEEIVSTFERAVARVEEHVALPPLDVVIVNYPPAAIAYLGIGGWASSANYLTISLDADHEHIKANLSDTLARTLYHEFSRTVRMQALGYEGTLFEKVVSEGIADYFDIELSKGEPFAWDNALSDDQFKELFLKLRKEADSNPYEGPDWFVGREHDAIPLWTGYTLGFYIVGAFLKDKNKHASDIIRLPSDEFKSILSQDPMEIRSKGLS